MSRFLLLVLILLNCQLAVCQTEGRTFKGLVIDKTTKEPLPFVNVFFISTTIGTSTLTDGKFVINNIPPGKYDLMVSFVGYKPFFTALDFSVKSDDYTKEIRLTIELESEATELKEVTIKPDTANWAKNYAEFKKIFLGETSEAKECIITNPHDIILYMDPKDRVLVAHSKVPIIVENRALGYKIYYYLYQFEYNYHKGMSFIYGVPRFEELKPKSEKVLKNWNRERANSYYGSVTHFMNALRDTSLLREKFTVRKIYKIPNRQRLPEALIKSKIDEFSKGTNGMLVFSADPKDSLTYYLRMKARPVEIDSIPSHRYTGAEFNKSAGTFMGIKGRYLVTFDGKVESEYMKWSANFTVKNQRTVLEFQSDTLKIYPNGYFEDVRSLLLAEGYLAWREKLSRMLPLEYLPSAKK